MFRDEDVPWTKTGAKIVHRVASIPAKSLDFHYGVTSSPPVGSTNDIGSNETKAQDVNTSEYQSPVMRLRFLAAKRADLLEKLDRLAVEERQILNKLNERNKRLRGFTLTLWDDSRRSEATAMRMSPSRIPVLSSLRKSCVPLRDIALLPDSRVQSHAKNEKLVGCKKRKPLGSIRSEESGIPRPRIVRPCGQRRM